MTNPAPYTDDDVELVARAEFDADQRRLVSTNPAALEPTPWPLPVLSHIRETYRERARAGLDALAAAGRIAPPNATTIATLAGHQRRITGLLVELTEVVTRTADLMDPPPKPAELSSPWEEPGEPCANCECPKKFHELAGGRCAGDFLHCPCPGYKPRTEGDT